MSEFQFEGNFVEVSLTSGKAFNAFQVRGLSFAKSFLQKGIESSGNDSVAITLPENLTLLLDNGSGKLFLKKISASEGAT